MKIGTKSLLFGLHQFAIHPFFVWVAWIIKFHRLPNWKETVCIIIHDWGYWGLSNIDGDEGDLHPIWAANWASDHLDNKGDYYEYLCLLHSRTMAKSCRMEPSELCIADKWGMVYVPAWLQVIQGRLTGETKELRTAKKYADAHRERMTDYQLFQDVKRYIREKGANTSLV